QVVLVLKDEPQDFALAVGLQRRLLAEALDLAQVELSLLAEEAAIEPAGVLGAKLTPGARDAGDAERNGQPIIPANFDLRLNRAPQLQHRRQQAAIPLQLAARWEALLPEVPTLAVDLPRHHVFRLGLHALEVSVERVGGLFEEGPEHGRVDLAPGVG